MHAGEATKIAGHTPRTRVAQTILAKYYRPGLEAAIDSVLKTCRVCQFNYPSSLSNHGMNVQRASCYPRLVISIDLAINLPKTKDNQNQHVLVIVDNFSRFVAALPLRDKSSKGLLSAFKKCWLTGPGLPLHIVVDNEMGIIQGCFAEFCQLYNITIHTTAPYSPSSNGLAEKNVQLVKNSIRAFSSQNATKTTWDKFLWLITQAHNNLVCKATGVTPYQLMFGGTNHNPLHNPISIISDPVRFQKLAPAEETKAAVLSVIQSVVDLRDQQRAKNMAYANDHKMPRPYHVGDVVLLKRMTKSLIHGIPNAMQAKYSGPYEITRLFTTIAELRHCAYGNIRITHINYIKPYNECSTDYLLPSSWAEHLLDFLKRKGPQIDKDKLRSDKISERLPDATNPKDPG